MNQVWVLYCTWRCTDLSWWTKSQPEEVTFPLLWRWFQLLLLLWRKSNFSHFNQIANLNNRAWSCDQWAASASKNLNLPLHDHICLYKQAFTFQILVTKLNWGLGTCFCCCLVASWQEEVNFRLWNNLTTTLKWWYEARQGSCTNIDFTQTTAPLPE